MNTLYTNFNATEKLFWIKAMLCTKLEAFIFVIKFVLFYIFAQTKHQSLQTITRPWAEHTVSNWERCMCTKRPICTHTVCTFFWMIKIEQWCRFHTIYCQSGNCFLLFNNLQLTFDGWAWFAELFCNVAVTWESFN